MSRRCEWGGAPLRAGAAVRWRVGVWDGGGAWCGWSAWARFSVAPLRPADWGGAAW
eukprot:gene3042-5618_t